MNYDQYKMAHQEPNWDAKHNGLIDALNSELGGVDLKVSDFQKDGFVFLNGAKGEGWYRYIQFGNYKLVEMRIIVTGVTLSQAWTNQDIVRVPDEIKQDHTNLQAGSGVNWMIFVNNTIHIMTTQSISADQTTEAHFLYFTN